MIDRDVVVTIPCWGAKYAERFVRYCLPTLLAPGNLPALATRFKRVVVIVYTTASDWALIEGPMVQQLRAIAKVEPTPLADQPDHVPFAGSHPGTMMKALFQMGFDRAWRTGSAFVPICCDAVYSDTFFNSAGQIIEVDGKRAAMTQGSGLRVDQICPFLDQMRDADGVIAVAPRPLMKAFLEGVAYGKHLATWPGTACYPAQIFWPVGHHGALMRCAHMYPAILLPDRHAVMQYSPDNDLAELTLTHPDQIGWLANSDQGFFFGLCEPGHPSEFVPDHPTDTANLREFCRQWLSPWKAGYMRRPIIWHDGESTDSWVDAYQAAEDIVGMILGVWAESR